MSNNRGLPSRGLKPASELAKNHPHGCRIKYVAGCRCRLCTQANTDYEKKRSKARKNGDWNGIVSAAKARRHLHKLTGLGVGRRAVHAATDIANETLTKIRSGEKKRIRARTERKILAVTPDCASDAAVKSGKRTQKLISELLEEGYTESFLAHRLGYRTGRLQFGERVSTRNAYRVENLHRELTT